MSYSALLDLFAHFVMLSFLAVGGFSALLPEMHRYVVEANQWMTSGQFAATYAIAQLSPGPNAMYVTLLGWNIAGWAGALVTTAAMLVPVCTLTIFVARMSTKAATAPVAIAIRRGLAPIALGLFMAGAWILTLSVNTDWRVYVLTLAAVVLLLRTPLNPLWLIAAGGLVGMTGWNLI